MVFVAMSTKLRFSENSPSQTPKLFYSTGCNGARSAIKAIFFFSLFKYSFSLSLLTPWTFSWRRCSPQIIFCHLRPVQNGLEGSSPLSPGWSGSVWTITRFIFARRKGNSWGVCCKSDPCQQPYLRLSSNRSSFRQAKIFSFKLLASVFQKILPALTKRFENYIAWSLKIQSVEKDCSLPTLFPWSS